MSEKGHYISQVPMKIYLLKKNKYLIKQINQARRRFQNTLYVVNTHTHTRTVYVVSEVNKR